MAYNMKRGARPLFKNLGSSDTPLEKASPMKHPHPQGEKLNHSAESHYRHLKKAMYVDENGKIRVNRYKMTQSTKDFLKTMQNGTWDPKVFEEAGVVPTIKVPMVHIKAKDNRSWVKKAYQDVIKPVGHTLLDVAGVVPVLGEGFDALNAAWYGAEGDYKNAALSTAATIPVIGWAATTAKWSKKGDAVLDINKAVQNVKYGKSLKGGAGGYKGVKGGYKGGKKGGGTKGGGKGSGSGTYRGDAPKFQGSGSGKGTVKGSGKGKVSGTGHGIHTGRILNSEQAADLQMTSKIFKNQFIDPVTKTILKYPKWSILGAGGILGAAGYQDTKNRTELLTTKNSAKYGDLVTNPEYKNKIENENITKSFETLGLNRKKMETERDQIYSNFKKNNPQLKNSPVVGVKNDPWFHALTTPTSDHYNSDYSYLQNQIFGAVEGGVSNLADTIKGYPVDIFDKK